jgi:hypothetical protein
MNRSMLGNKTIPKMLLYILDNLTRSLIVHLHVVCWGGGNRRGNTYTDILYLWNMEGKMLGQLSRLYSRLHMSVACMKRLDN